MAELSDGFSRVSLEVYLNSQGQPVLDTQTVDGRIQLTEGYELTTAGQLYCKNMGVEQNGDCLRRFMTRSSNTTIVMNVFRQELGCIPA